MAEEYIYMILAVTDPWGRPSDSHTVMFVSTDRAEAIRYGLEVFTGKPEWYHLLTYENGGGIYKRELFKDLATLRDEFKAIAAWRHENIMGCTHG